ncbi:hypothetical protein F5148DRAFT_93550 [Russula earlei]|uniref:Uncharacterized protein n=1 Tax=Russula earlei TaxID=71964 RepID=A0ACC0U791_9AGAM|nr:hypothetical protein F5148DRAFT_93550 [Russula earlei]
MPSSLASALKTLVHVSNVIHTCAGIYMWEFITTLDFEWEVYTGRRPWRWSFLVYVAARVLALACFILTLVGFNLTREFNCEAWLRSLLVTAWLAAACASLLLVLRGVAIWGRDSRIVAICMAFWLANIAGSFYATTRGQVVWSPVLHLCLISHTDQYRWSIMINFVQDTVLLSIMIFGVLHKRNATHLWNMLYFQGLLWILAATMTELPSVALGFKNINDGWNMMFQYPHLTFMVIASSRAYRDLFQYITSDQDSYTARRGRKPQGMQNTPRCCQDMQVTVTKTIEFDVELRLGDDAPALPRSEDEESGSYSPELTKEEQQIRTLELQMRQDLEI